MSRHKPLISIGLGTYKRVQMLENALHSVSKLQIPKDVTLQLIVCDNDPNQSARPVFEATQTLIPFTAQYLFEVNRGIVYVRNKILQESINSEATFLAFFDDDETVAEDWLVRLISCFQKYQADAVAGKAIYLNNKGEEILFLNKKKRMTGERMTSASTNNIMFSLDFCKIHSLKFHPAFNESGGSDTFFFEQFHRQGGKIVHCGEALSYETVVEERNSVNWLNNRVFRDAYNLHLRNKLRFGLWIGSLKSLIKICSIVIRYPFFSSKSKKKAAMKIKGILGSISGKPFRAYDKIYGH